MGYQLSQYGEEYVFTNNVDGATLNVGVYDDASNGATGDAIGDADDISAITTEPGNGNYSRQSVGYTVENPTGSDVVANNDAQVTFDFSDTTADQDVDSYFVEVSFTSDVVAGETAGSTHLLFTGSLEQTRNIGSIDTLNISAGGAELALE